MSDGASIYECASPDEIIDLLQGGQGVFGIAVCRVIREVEASRGNMKENNIDDVDELAARRQIRKAV
jgi:hypothetical protein